MASGRAVAVVVIAIVAIAGFALLGGNVAEWTDSGFRLHLPIQFVAIDSLAGGTDATTTQVSIYDTTYELIETVTISTAAGTDSAQKYWSGEYVYLKVDDLTDTSLCHQFLRLMVPYHSADTDTKHYVTLDTVDTDASWDAVADLANGTNVADSGTYDTSQSGTTAQFVFQVITPTADKGYYTSWNFLEGCDNAAYYVFRVSGTGRTRVIFDTQLPHYFDGTNSWYAYRLQDTDITRNQKSDGTYDPVGYFTLVVQLDLTGITSGDSVTFLHGLYYYSDFDYYQDYGTWGPDSASVTESFTIQP